MDITNEEFEKLSDFIRIKTGVNLNKNKKALVLLRLTRRLERLDLSNFDLYYDFLINDKTGSELNYFIYYITTHYTFFLREKEQFEVFKNFILPSVVENITDGDLRIWSAATSSGEEAYTIAMILDDYFGFDKKYWNKELLATDISRKVIQKAEKGIYNDSELLEIPSYWKLHYFNSIGEKQYQIKENLRKEVTFRSFNLINPIYPFKRKFHVIFCRNVLIYFSKETKVDVIKKLKDSLLIGGYLILGLSEAIDYLKFGFTYVQPSVYRKDK